MTLECEAQLLVMVAVLDIVIAAGVCLQNRAESKVQEARAFLFSYIF